MSGELFCPSLSYLQDRLLELPARGNREAFDRLAKDHLTLCTFSGEALREGALISGAGASAASTSAVQCSTTGKFVGGGVGAAARLTADAVTSPGPDPSMQTPSEAERVGRERGTSSVSAHSSPSSPSGASALPIAPSPSPVLTGWLSMPPKGTAGGGPSTGSHPTCCEAPRESDVPPEPESGDEEVGEDAAGAAGLGRPSAAASS